MTLFEWLRLKHGRATVLAVALRVPVSFVSRMAAGHKAVPEKQAVAIETATGQQVTRRDLRPHDWGDIWPELIGVLHPWPPAAGVCKATSAVPLNPVNVDQGFAEIDLGPVPPCGANDALHTSAPEVA